MAYRSLAVAVVLLFSCFLVSAERGVPLGPCKDGAATHYGDDYIFNPAQGGTCGLEPPKYANYGRLSASSTGANSIYNPLNPNRADGCGVCYEVYGPNGAVTVIIGDHGAADNNDFNLILKGDSGAWNEIIDEGLGSHAITYRQVSCPQTDGGLDWVKGNVKLTWQTSGANNFYFEVHIYNHRVGIKKVELTSSLHTTPVELIRKEVQNNFVYGTTDAGGSLPSVSDVGVPFTLKITSFLNEQLTLSIGTAGQNIAAIAYTGSTVNTLDFGAQFTNTDNSNSDDADCKPVALPKVVYDEALYSESHSPSYGWRHVNSYLVGQAPNFAFGTGCADGSKCISVQFNQFGGMILGASRFMKADFTGITFKVKGASAFDGLSLALEGQTDAFPVPVTTSWATFTMNFSDYPTIPDLVDPGHFRFTANNVSPVIYFDSISMVGGDGRANYLPGAKVFPSSNGGTDGGDGGDGGAASTLNSALSDLM